MLASCNLYLAFIFKKRGGTLTHVRNCNDFIFDHGKGMTTAKPELWFERALKLYWRR